MSPEAWRGLHFWSSIAQSAVGSGRVDLSRGPRQLSERCKPCRSINVLAVVPVADFGGAHAWYERLLGRPADNLPMEGQLVEWRVTDSGWVQVTRDAVRAGSGQLNFAVDDLARHVAKATSASIASSYEKEAVVVAAVSIRNLDDDVRERLRLRAARHGRSMEAEIRAILADAVREPSRSEGPFTTLLDRFAHIGGVELELPPRSTRPRAADLPA